MNLIRLAINRPIAVLAAVMMVVMFGLVALATIPIQLTPDVRRPLITIKTVWRGAAPAEVEREITNRQEEVLKGLEGLELITSRSQDGSAQIDLEFAVATNMDRALLLVSNRLDRVGNYPAEADQPTFSTSSSEDSPIAWFTLSRAKGNDRPIHTYGDVVEDIIQDRLERVPGVSNVNVYGGSEREMEVIVDPGRMAAYGLTVTELVRTLRDANASVSAGDIDEGKRRYVVRSDGEFSGLDDVRDVVLRSLTDGGGRTARVTVGDIARVRFAYKDPTGNIRHLGDPALAINTVRETGANVIETMKGIHAAVEELNRDLLPPHGLVLEQVYDETVYINSSIDLVQQNIVIGGALAGLILMIFLRSIGATLVVSLAIPVSVIGSFVAMTVLGRSLNVISMAGIAFAIGMVVDAAIVVLENIFRHREMGQGRAEAAYNGAQQVWGAVLVSALTTVMVFIPILVMQLEVGQLFRDIAVALSVSVMLSLLVAVTAIPALATHLLGKSDIATVHRLRLPVVDDLAGLFVRAVLAFTRGVARSRLVSLAVVLVICGGTGFATWLMLPKLDYLPDGNRNLVFGVVVPPPGYNLSTTAKIATRVEDQVRPLWARDSGPKSAPGAPPKIKHFFFVAHSATTFIGASVVESHRAAELVPVLRQAAFAEPGTFGLISQSSLFGRGFSGTRSIELNVQGPRLQEILDTALAAVGLMAAVLPPGQGTQIRPKPGLELGAPEVRVLPDRVKLADNGVTARELGDTLDAFNDGMRVTEITIDGKRMDLTLKGPTKINEDTQGIANLQVVTSSGQIVPVSSLARVEVTSGPTEIRHIERLRTVTLEIRPPEKMPLESAMATIQTQVIDKIVAGGVAEGVRLSMSGTADKLTETWNHMVIDLIMAVVIVYLVMAVLFESFVYPAIIVLSVPLATAGGVGGLTLLNIFQFQALDMLTLLGFIILIGIVVNNAILLVHQTLFHIRQEGCAVAEAIVEATRNRVRPIFMSTLTSVFGMLPLVVFGGAGSELYRGLGSVVLGGLALSAVLTLLIIPPLLTLVAGIVEKRHKTGSPGRTADAAA